MTSYDIIIIGTGAGGSTLAYALAETGKRILILERGEYLVRAKDNWDPEQVFRREIYHTQERWLTKDDAEFRPGQAYLVGGNTKLFGAALLRLRERDFGDIAYADGVSPAWPVPYKEFESYYDAVERLYFVHGERGEDPTEPPATKPYPYPKLSHEPRIREVFEQLKTQGLHPFHLPIGVQRFEDNLAGSPCIRCNTCDGFPCLTNAKGDAERSCLIHALAHPNVELVTGVQVERLETDESGRRVRHVQAKLQGQTVFYEAETVVLSAGAINSAIVLLKSANARHPQGLANGSGLVGRNYMCHNNSAMLAIDFFKENPTLFQKTIGLNDYYDGKGDEPVGHIQLIGKATEGVLHAQKPFVPRPILNYMGRHSVDWWFCTEDLPKKENGVTLTSEGRIRLSHTPTNRAPHRRLITAFSEVLRRIGFKVLLTQGMPINAVAHQVGTAVFGRYPETSVLNLDCRAHEVENLYVVDGSFFPSSSHCNPALTIAANALRVGDHLKEKWELRRVVEKEKVVMSDLPPKHVVILGGGFGGLYAALEFEKRLSHEKNLRVTLVNSQNFFLFTPMLHEVAASDLDVTTIVNPIRKMLKRVEFFKGDVASIDLAKRTIDVSHGDSHHHHDMPYDHLVLAMGSETNYFNLPGLQEHAMGMKTLGDAFLLRNHLIDLLEEADFECCADEREPLLTIVVAGGGFSGVETMGAINDFMRTAVKSYPHLHEDHLRLVLVHPGDTLLPELGKKLGQYAQQKLAQRKVEIILNTRVQGCTNDQVQLSNGATISANTLVWTAGTSPSPLLAAIPCAKERGKVAVNEFLEVVDWPGVWAVGDCAAALDKKTGKPYPPTAQNAYRQGPLAARNILAALHGKEKKPFEYQMMGQLAAIGHRTGVARIFGVSFSGYIAWWLWRTVYLLKLPRFEKKLRVVMDWTLDVFFSKDLVQFLTRTSSGLPHPEASTSPENAPSPETVVH